MEGEWKPPEWWYRKQRPASDEAYFENMSRVIFQAGLDWNVIDKKWPTTKTAFAQFSMRIQRLHDKVIATLRFFLRHPKMTIFTRTDVLAAHPAHRGGDFGEVLRPQELARLNDDVIIPFFNVEQVL